MLRSKKAEPRTPHFLSLNQDIVAWSQEKKCGLKYTVRPKIEETVSLVRLQLVVRLFIELAQR
jgi:hypothetical protein